MGQSDFGLFSNPGISGIRVQIATKLPVSAPDKHNSVTKALQEFSGGWLHRVIESLWDSMMTLDNRTTFEMSNGVPLGRAVTLGQP
ncbi:hypothetical protein J6590_081311 [Homalodisca vitripennis]|nr:hypothetical protein J6590_081311 [Homalodisca vitripennis]